jgi:hypothetical protein
LPQSLRALHSRSASRSRWRYRMATMATDRVLRMLHELRTEMRESQAEMRENFAKLIVLLDRKIAAQRAARETPLDSELAHRLTGRSARRSTK